LLAACAAAVADHALGAGPVPGAGRGDLGLVIHSFPVRSAAGRDRISDPVRFLEHCRTLGARGIQVGLGAPDGAYADSLPARAEAASMYLEGIVSLPRGDADLGRFEAEVRTAKRAGASVVRTVCLRGRRYETFDSLAAFRRFADDAAR